MQSVNRRFPPRRSHTAAPLVTTAYWMPGMVSSCCGSPTRGRPVAGTTWMPLRTAFARTAQVCAVSSFRLLNKVPSKSRPISLIAISRPSCRSKSKNHLLSGARRSMMNGKDTARRAGRGNCIDCISFSRRMQGGKEPKP